MRRFAMVLVMSAVAMPTAAFAGNGTQVAITKLTAAGGCKKKPPTHKAWCLASAWSKGKAAPLPKKSLAGIAISLSGSGEKPIVDFAALIVNKDEVGLEVWTGEDSDGHSKADAIKALIDVLEGKTKTAKLNAEAAGQVDASQTYAPSKKAGEWTWQSPEPNPFVAEHLRKVGNVWIDMSTEAKGGANADGSAIITVLTDAWTK